jgi:ribonuclease VapC
MGRVERYHHGVEHQDASVHETVEQIAKITGESQAEARRLSAASYLECGIVLDSQRDPIISRGLDDLLQEAELVVQPVTERQARLARQAYTDFGKGSGHPAGLNFGDCLSYALALDLRESLLWKGNALDIRASNPRLSSSD